MIKLDVRKQTVNPCVSVWLLLGLLPVVGQDVACALQQVVPQEQTSQRMLHTTTHLHQVLQNVLARLRERAHIDHAHRYQQIPEKKKRHEVRDEVHLDMGLNASRAGGPANTTFADT